jgi:hypothetical protein
MVNAVTVNAPEGRDFLSKIRRNPVRIVHIPYIKNRINYIPKFWIHHNPCADPPNGAPHDRLFTININNIAHLTFSQSFSAKLSQDGNSLLLRPLIQPVKPMLRTVTAQNRPFWQHSRRLQPAYAGVAAKRARDPASSFLSGPP